MTILRMDDVLLMVDDLEADLALFAELGLELEGGRPFGAVGQQRPSP